MAEYISVAMTGLVFTLLYRGLGLFFRQRLQMERRLKAISDLQVDEQPFLDERLRLPFAQRVFSPLLRACGMRIQRLTPRAMRGSTERKLSMAGLQLTAEQWSGWYVLASGSGLVIALLLGSLLQRGVAAGIFLGMIGLLIGAYLPRLLLGQAISKRQRAILRALPDVLDLLTVSVKAGLGFDSALQRVTEKLKGPLPVELGKVLHEIKVGVLRKDALRSLADRTGVAELHGFVGTIIQADQLGVSISNVLQLQSESLRERRRQSAEEQAIKAPVKMLFPLILFIFPTLFVVLLGPAVIQVMSNLIGL